LKKKIDKKKIFPQDKISGRGWAILLPPPCHGATDFSSLFRVVFVQAGVIMAEQLRHRLPMSEGVFTFRVEQTENGSLVATLHRETAWNQTPVIGETAWNHTPVIAGGGGPGSYYNRYRHRYRHVY